MFSATFTPRETKLAAALMIEPQQIMLASVQEKHTNITQHLQWADNSHHQHKMLMHWLADPELDQAVVFASTQIETERLADELIELGISATSLHGAMPQMVRNRRLESLRKGRVRVLVATDVAARGIDVPTISHVFNYGLPMKAEDYVHRIGRTGRAGREGISVTFAQRNDAFKIRQIERYINSRINVTQIKGLEPQLSHEDFKAGKPSKGRGGARPSGSRAGSRSGVPHHGARSGAPRSAEGGESRGGFGHGKPRGDAPRADRTSARYGRAEPRSEAGGFGNERAARPAFGEEHRPRREHRGKQTESRAFAKPFADTRSAGRSTGRPANGAKPRANRKPSF